MLLQLIKALVLCLSSKMEMVAQERQPRIVVTREDAVQATEGLLSFWAVRAVTD